MERERSLPCSQEPFTGLYFEPDQSSPYCPILEDLNSNTRIILKTLKTELHANYTKKFKFTHVWHK
jgi:hypothetical protein